MGRVNVISGASRTGKSAIIPIIDYCLGADKCTIPVKTIRDACEWFGVLVETREGQKLFARREPGLQKSTGDMCLLEAKTVSVPLSLPTKNTTVDAVKRNLDQLAGLSALQFDSESDSGFKGRPSFRDLSSFLFQPQNVVANPNILFYKADSMEHREKLRNIFPYVLGAVTPEVLAKRYEHVRLSRELRRKEQELKTVQQVSVRWESEIQGRIAQARELGLIQVDVPPGSLSLPRAIGLLRGVVDGTASEVQVTGDTVKQALVELERLQDEEASISQQLSRLRRRSTEMAQLRSNSLRYREALGIQQDRLQVSEWLARLYDPNHNCPVCGNVLETTERQLAELLASLKNIEQTATQLALVPAAFDRESARVGAEIASVTEKLRGIQIRRSALERMSEEAKGRQYSLMQISRFIGNLEGDLRTFGQLGQDSELKTELEGLRARVVLLAREISEGEIRERLKRALEAVDANAARLLPRLDTERPSDPVSLSTQELSVAVKGVERVDWLWEIGSGSNWLSYHLAISLGLQQFFLSRDSSPVPGLLVYDQPSQVYFPKRLVDRGTSLDAAEADPELPDEDVEAVRTAYRVMSDVAVQSKGLLQIIVLDHAPESIWSGLSGVHKVEEWRRGLKLVPEEWLG